MIRSDMELEITRESLSDFIATLDVAQNESELDNLGEQKKKIYLKAIEGEVQELSEQVNDYEKLRRGIIESFDSHDLLGLPSYAVRKRIALNKSLEELAKDTGISVKKLEEYEEDLFVDASPKDLAEVIRILEISVPDSLLEMLQFKITELKRTITTSLGNLEKFILPEEIKQGENHSLGYLKLFSRLKGIYKEYAEGFIFQTKDSINLSSFSTLRYKAPKGVTPELVYSYTAFVSYLAKVFSDCCEMQGKHLYTDYKIFREQILTRYGAINLESCVNYMWDLGIPVVPLKAKGGFHGACWRSEGKNVIVLKQQVNSEARLLFDLLHEYWHATQEPDLQERSVIDFAETLSQTNQDAEETAANNFASDVIFNGKSKELIHECYVSANWNLPFIKNAVIRVSEAHGVDTGALANFVARDIQDKNSNWWGAAQTLQNKNNPYSILLKVLEERLDIGDIDNTLDRELIMNLMEA